MSDSKGRPTAADIPDKEMLTACKMFTERSEDFPTPDKSLASKYPVKVIMAKIDKLHARGLLECGVSRRTSWLTPKGKAFLEAA